MKKRDIIISSILLLIFISMYLLVLFNKNVIDEVIYNFIISVRCDFLDNYFKIITHLGDPILVSIVVIIGVILFKKREKILLLISVGGGTLINTIIKNTICRERPDHLRLIKQGGYSFPSGHSMITICLYGLLIYLVLKNIKNKYIKIISIIILSIIIISLPISRIYVGVHYPTDVIAGLCLGGIILIFSINSINSVWGNKNEEGSSK